MRQMRLKLNNLTNGNYKAETKYAVKTCKLSEEYSATSDVPSPHSARAVIR